MTIEEIYGYADNIGVLVFSTIHGEEVHSRVAHFNGFDDEGIYFRTMINKPFYRQLVEGGRVTVCGCSDSSIIGHEEDGTPIFPTVYSIRIIGEVRKVAPEEIIEKAKRNDALKTAATDMEKYPTMKEGNFVIHKGKVEIFDTDFEMKTRDHKVIRTRVSFGGVPFNQAGPRITDSCVSCGACKSICSFSAIEEGQPYRVIPEYCDDCGSCSTVCPVGAIEESLIF